MKNILQKRNIKLITISYSEILLHGANIFDNKKQNEIIQNIRNFYGENVGFYFLFNRHLKLWLSIPILLGFIVFLTTFATNLDNVIVLGYKYDYRDFVLFCFIVLLTLWGNFIYKINN